MAISIASQWESNPGASAEVDTSRAEGLGCVKVADHLSVSEASELLDWLEGHGIEPREVSIDAEGRMTVRWVA
jgi:hypothetical protein